MSNKPLTKALHTVRVVEHLAAHLATINAGQYASTYDLFLGVLSLLGNTAPMDETLKAACLAACKKTMS